jgi:hypothetical protein
MSELSEAEAQHQRLKSIIGEQYRHADPGPVEAWALRAVFRLLCEHAPTEWSGYNGVWCETHWHEGGAESVAWPCGVYQAVEMESSHGE